jgi:hypothetical protein
MPISDYLKAGEKVTGFGYGGSESLAMFLQKPGMERFVRKVLSEHLTTTHWHEGEHDVMLPPYAKAKAQADYLLGLPASVKLYFPEVLDVVERDRVELEGNTRTVYHELIYDMTFVSGIEVSEFVRQYQPPAKIVAILYSELFRFLRERIHSERRRVPGGRTLERSYFEKIERRLELSQETAPKTFNDCLLRAEEIMLNGETLRNIGPILKTLRGNPQFLKVLEPKFHSLVMGDTNTENIKIGNIDPLLEAMELENPSFNPPPFTAETLQIRFLDPRAIGFHEHGEDTGADDPMYDNKPWHNSLGNYDMIHGEHFDLVYLEQEDRPHLSVMFHKDTPYQMSYERIDAYFAEAMRTAWKYDDPTSDVSQNDPYWLIRFVFLMGTHFMAMPPFHFSRTRDETADAERPVPQPTMSRTIAISRRWVEEGTLIDDPQHQRRPLAIYAEGIKWLNLTLDMLEGKTTSFLGVPVPKI